MKRTDNLWRREAVVVAIAAAAAVGLRLLDWAVDPFVVVGLVAAVGTIVALHDRWQPPAPVDWPSAADPKPSPWTGLDPQVRRLVRLVEGGSQRASDDLRAVLAVEVSRRLVAHRSADPADPLASAAGLVPSELLTAATVRGRLTPNRLDTVLDQLEDL